MTAMLHFFVLCLWLVIATPLPGAHVDFRKTFSGNGGDRIAAVATDREGNVYATGATTSFDFPLKNAFQTENTGAQLVTSSDGGRTWSPLGFLPSLGARAPAAHPTDPNIVLVTAVDGVYRSTDGGRTWRTVVDLRLRAERERIGYVDVLAWNRQDPSVVYVASTGGLLKSTNAGATWTLLPSSIQPVSCCLGAIVAIDPFEPRRLLYSVQDRLYMSADAGATWTLIRLAGLHRPRPVIDPTSGGVWFAVDHFGVYKSADAGLTWRRLPVDSGLFSALVAIAGTPGRYLLQTQEGLRESLDGGESWTPLESAPAIEYVWSIAADPFRPSRLLASGYNGGTWISEDGGRKWEPVVKGRALADLSYDSGRAGRVSASGQVTSDAYLTKFDSNGEIVYSTYLGGFADDRGDAIAVGGDGSVYLAGRTQSDDFPCVVTRFGNGSSGNTFVAKLDPEGTPVWVTLFNNLGVAALAVDGYGQVHLTGSGADVPLTPDAFSSDAQPGSAFLLKLAADGQKVLYGTLLGTGSPTSMALDSTSNIFIGGQLAHASFPGPEPQPGGPATAHLLKLSSSGSLESARVLSTLPAKLALDSDGNIVVAGTASISQPAFQGRIDTGCPHNSGGLFTRPSQRAAYMTDVWVARYNASASAALFTRLIGGSCRELVSDLTIAGDGAVLLTGQTYSEPFPLVGAVAGPPEPGEPKAFVIRLDRDGSRLLFSSYLDSSEEPRIIPGPGDSLFFAGNSPTLDQFGAKPPWSWVWKISTESSAGRHSITRVVNGFQRLSGPISPGEIVVVEAPGFEPETEIDLGINASQNLPRQLGGVAVLFNGEPAPLIATHREEILCIAPASLRGQDIALVELFAGSDRLAQLAVEVTPSRPAFFPQVRNEDGSLNTQDNPAPQGSLLSFFFTGLGLPEAPPPDGSITPDPAPRMPIELFLTFERTRPGGAEYVEVQLKEVTAVPGFVFGMWEARVPAPARAGAWSVRLIPGQSMISAFVGSAGAAPR